VECKVTKTIRIEVCYCGPTGLRTAPVAGHREVAIPIVQEHGQRVASGYDIEMAIHVHITERQVKCARVKA
jgi:hypothetical protein